ncbi:MAG TPA: MOSC domain-containing protein [Actinomycetota bacterium]|jgi:MOSC domain-containing protein YiiM|nr:MOSC domain-containing protein [Actinomycetota bacterium]
MPSLISVNVGRPRTFELKGNTHTSSIWKSPVTGRVRVRETNIEGDRQSDLNVHGGIDKAVYAYAVEDYGWWSEHLGRELGPGTFGDNLTTRGLDLRQALVGEHWRVGTAVLEVSEPRLPCFKLGFRMEDPNFPRKFSDAGRWGTYLRVVEEGEIGAGDEIDVVERPDHDVTIARIARTNFGDFTGLAELLATPGLSEKWRARIRKLSRSG